MKLKSVQDKYIAAFIKKGKKRFYITKLVSKGLVWLTIALGVADISLILTLFIPCYNRIPLAFFLGSVVVTIGVIFEYSRVPKKELYIKKLDQEGFQERLMTAVENFGNEDIISQLQKRDTLDKMEQFSIKEHYRYSISWITLCGLLCLSTATYILPQLSSEATSLAQQRHDLKELVQSEIERVEQCKEQIQQSEELSTDEKNVQYSKVLDETLKELQSIESLEELERCQERAEMKVDQQLAKETNNSVKDEINRILNKKENNTLGSQTELSQEQQNIMNMALERIQSIDNKNATKKQLEQALSKKQLKQLDKIAKSLNNKKLQEALNKVNQGMEGHSLSQPNLQQLAEQIKKASQQSNQAVAQNGSQLNEQNSSQGGKNGSGTMSGIGQGNENSSQGVGKNRGSKMGLEVEYDSNVKQEQVSISEKAVGNDEALSGEKHDYGESYLSESDNGLTWSGDSVEYNQVIGEYSEEAYNEIDKSDVPESMKEIVKSYFDSLNQ